MQKFSSVDEYISTFPSDIQAILEDIRTTIKKIVPNAIETISYQMPTYKLTKNLVHFAAFKNHIGFYPTPSAILYFEKELQSFKTSKGAIQFPIDKPIPYELIKNIVNFRVQQVKTTQVL